MTAAAIAVYNVARYGNPFDTGYLPQENFGGDWLQGIAGLLVSPGPGPLPVRAGPAAGAARHPGPSSGGSAPRRPWPGP